VRAHLIQLDIAWEDKAANHARIGELVARAEIEPGDLILLPEMFDTGFSLNLETTAADPDVSSRFLRDLATRTRSTVIASVPVIESNGRGRNRALTFGPDGKLLGTYDKVHPFSYGRESERFDGGDGASVVVCPLGADARRTNVFPVVCYDLRFPELFRVGLDQGAEVFVVVANWPRARAEHWRTLLIARAIENQGVVLGVNRAGEDPNLAYAGGSIGVDPRGRILGEAGSGEGILSVVVDLAGIGTWREEFPAWRDRRIPVGPVHRDTSAPVKSPPGNEKNQHLGPADRLTPAELRVSSNR